MRATRASEPHPEVQAFLELYNSMDTPGFEDIGNADSPDEVRRQMEERLLGGEPIVELPSVEDRTIDGPGGELHIRIYEPREAPTEPGPLLLFFHGGAWAVGSLDTHDDDCRSLAHETGYPVVAVDYRLAPEHPFPAGLDDCYAALEWASEHAADLDADPDRIAVVGDSAGGNLAAAVSLLARDREGPAVAYQALVYPVTGDITETESFEQNREGYFLEFPEDEHGAEDVYLAGPVDRGNVYARPRREHDLSGLPPATVLTAGFDPLRDDGAAYAQRLEDAGVPVSYHNFEDMVHGFFSMLAEPMALERAHEAHELVAGELREALQ